MEPFDDYLLGHRDAERQLVLNFVMMIPFGFLLPTLKRRGFWCCLGWTLVVTLSIELMQPLLSAARRSDITDVITNTLGGVVGYLLYLPLRRFCARRNKGEALLSYAKHISHVQVCL